MWLAGSVPAAGGAAAWLGLASPHPCRMDKAVGNGSGGEGLQEGELRGAGGDGAGRKEAGEPWAWGRCAVGMRCCTSRFHSSPSAVAVVQPGVAAERCEVFQA